MKFTVLGLASLFSVVHCQTVPYVSFNGTNLSNHSYMDMNLVGSNDDGSDSVQCHTDLDTCCDSVTGPHRGDWYFPDMNRLLFSQNFGVIYEKRSMRRVDLRRCGEGGASGMYRCDIATVHSDDNMNRGRVYVGLYSSGGEN